MKVLIIDDSDYKITSLTESIRSWRSSADIFVARSFQNGLHKLKEWNPDLVLLDMTLPTSESASGHLEGRMRFFGGRELLAEMELEQLSTAVIIVTQFDRFGEHPNSVDRETLFAQLLHRFPDVFRGGIYYSNIDSGWKVKLTQLLKKIGKQL